MDKVWTIFEEIFHTERQLAWYGSEEAARLQMGEQSEINRNEQPPVYPFSHQDVRKRRRIEPEPRPPAICEIPENVIKENKTNPLNVPVNEKPKGQRHQCHICSKDFSHRQYVELHISAVHLKLKPHACEQCDARFSQKVSLKVHVSRVHWKLKPHPCDKCEAKFATRQELSIHDTAVHLKQKPHECDQCSAKFSQKGSLKTHVARVHMKLKPHACEKCEAKFASRQEMSLHDTAMHLKPDA